MNVSELKQAGFSDQEVTGYVSSQKPVLKSAGFSDQEVDEYFGTDQKEGLWKGFIKPTLKAIPRVAGATAGSFAAFPVAGIAGLGKLLATGSLEEAEKTMRGIQEIPQRLISTPEEAKGMENIGLAMKPFEMAGQGWKDIVGLTPLKGTIAEPIAGTIGEASAMFGFPGAKGRITKPITELRAMGDVLKPVPEPFIPSPNLRAEIAKSERIGAPVTIPPVRPSAEPTILKGAPTRTPVDQMRFEAISQKPSFEWTADEKMFMDRFGASDVVQPLPEPSIVVPQVITPRERVIPAPRVIPISEQGLLGPPGPDWIPGKPQTILRPMGASGYTAGQQHQVLPDGRVVVIPRPQAPVAPVGETLAPPRMVIPPPRQEVIKPQGEAQARPETPPPLVLPESVAPPSAETLPIPRKPLEGVPEKVTPAPSGEAIISEFKKDTLVGGNLARGMDYYVEKMQELPTSEVEKILSWSQGSETTSWQKRFIGADTAGILRERGIPVDSIEYQQKLAPKPPIAMGVKKPEGTILTWLKEQGGINDKDYNEVFSSKESGLIGLVNKKSGKSMDVLATNAKDYGWQGISGPEDLYRALTGEKKTILPGTEEAVGAKLIKEEAKPIRPEEQEGFVELKAKEELRAGDLNKGDELLIKGEKYQHKGFDSEGKAIIKDGETFNLDPWEKVDADAVKRVEIDRQAQILEQIKKENPEEYAKILKGNTAELVKEWEAKRIGKGKQMRQGEMFAPPSVGDLFKSQKGAISPNLLGLGLPKVAKNIWEKGKEAGIYNKYLNRFAAIEDTIKKARELGVTIKPGEDAGIRAREYLGIGGKVKSVLEDKTFRITPEGKIEITGEGLNPILKDYDAKSTEKKVDVRELDLQEYMIARRTIEDLQRPKNEWNKEFIASPEQVNKAKADMVRLNQKYGNNLGLLEETAKRLYEYQKRVLNLLVDSGNISAETYQNILSKNPHYVPFDRIIDAEGVVSGGMPVAKKPFTGAWSPVKKIKGSELEVHNTLESIIKNTYRIMDVSERNIVARNVATLKDIPELGITEVEAPIVPVGKVKHHAVIDPKFRESITTFATSLGAKFKTGKEVVPGRAFGTYQPGTQTAMHRQATPESTFAHEAGHFFDDKFGLKDRFYKRGATKEVAEELIVHMKNIGESKNRLKKPEERFARGFEWWLTQRALAEKDLPKFSASMEKIISDIPELKPLLDIRPSAEKAFESQTQTIWGKSPFVPKGNIIEVFEGGKRKFYEVPKNLYESMTGLNETSSGLFIKLMSIPANILRTGATITPEFASGNFFRDQWTAFMQTQLGFRPFIDPIGAVADILGKKEVYYDWLRAGGAYSTFTELSRSNLRKTVNDLTGNKSLLSNLNIISRAQDISQLLEMATRGGIYKAGMRKGLTPVEAAFQYRESSVDFARRGAKTKDLNRVIAFFNAGVQGMDKSIRTAIANPASFTAKGIATITIPSALLYMVNRNDADYFEKPQWERDIFWMTRGPGGYYIRIRKPILYGQLFGSSVERFLSYLDKTDPEAFKGFIKTLIDAATPVQGDPAAVIIPTGLKPLIENETNWSFFKQRNIIPQAKSNLIPEEQYGRYTPESAKAIGKIFEVSPSKVENLATGIAGGTGRYALEAADIAGRLVNILPPKETQRPTEITDIPAVRGFVSRRAESSPESIQRLFERFKEVDQAHATLSNYERTGSWEKVPELLRKYPEIVQYDALKIGVDVVRDLNQDIDLILKSRMPMDQKELLLRDIERKRMEAAQKINRLMPKGKTRFFPEPAVQMR